MLKHDISLIQEVPAENHEQISRVLLEFIERQCVLKEKCHMWRRACGVAVLCMASVSSASASITFTAPPSGAS
jgi:hypothetical protein